VLNCPECEDLFLYSCNFSFGNDVYEQVINSQSIRRQTSVPLQYLIPLGGTTVILLSTAIFMVASRKYRLKKYSKPVSLPKEVVRMKLSSIAAQNEK